MKPSTIDRVIVIPLLVLLYVFGMATWWAVIWHGREILHWMAK